MNACLLRGALVAVFAQGLSLAALAGEARKPNVLLIVADDLGYGELGCQGNDQIPTPRIDSLASGGVRFRSGYVSGPYCSPTRAGLMTGRYQQRFGHEFNPGPATQSPATFGLTRDVPTLAERLKAAGYATGMFGKWHLGYRPEFTPTRRGFDTFFGFLGGAHSYLDANADPSNPILRGTTPVKSIDYTTKAFAHEAVAFIEAHREVPWFVYLPFNAVHAPLQPPPDAEDTRQKVTDVNRRKFSGMLAAMDTAVGTVLDKLRELSLEEDTLIVFISDNGGPTAQTTSGNGPLRGFKAQVWEGGIRVPFLMRWKGHLPEGLVYKQSVIQLDIAPTALAAAGAETDPEFDGVDLLPYLKGEKTGAPHDTLFWRFGRQRAVRAGDWKLTDMGQGPHLFNLARDIGEKDDLAATMPGKLKELERLYATWDAHNVAPKWGGPARDADTKAAKKAKKAAKKAAERNKGDDPEN
jgi:arylsulfatase A-like enzyme